MKKGMPLGQIVSISESLAHEQDETICFGIDHEREGNHLVYYNPRFGCDPNWIKPQHLDRRKNFLTFFKYDPFTGKKIILKFIKSRIKDQYLKKEPNYAKTKS